MDPERTTVSDLIRTFPAVSAILERNRIDVRCDGGRSLAEACGEAGVEATSLLAELGLGTRPRTRGDPPALAARIATIESRYHARLHVDLPRLGVLVARVARAHGARRAELHEVAMLFPLLADAVERDLDQAARVLFPALLRGERPPAFQDEDRHRPLVARIRARCDGDGLPADAGAEWRALAAGLATLERDLSQLALAIAALRAEGDRADCARRAGA